MKKNYLSSIFCLFAIHAFAYLPMNSHGKPTELKAVKSKTTFSAECAQSKSQIDLKVNNVRARLQGGGDLWWNLKGYGSYVVPNVPTGTPKVSSIFAAALWMGGVDAGGNIKTACNMYRSLADNDWWPGPLADNATIAPNECANWDKHFEVLKTEIDAFKEAYNKANKDANGKVTDSDFDAKIPKNLKGWPAKGNPFFQVIHGFSFVSTKNYASFYDKNGDNLYNPLHGDYPRLNTKASCDATSQPDQMVFWMFNDAGGVHTQSNGQAIGMEVHATSFAYATNDELNNATFLQYKATNRSSQNLDSVFLSLWTDPDLGCYVDDYIGVDTKPNYLASKRAMMYVYNENDVDGCDPLIDSYGDKSPVLGIEQINTLKNTDGTEIKTSFMYFNNNIVAQSPAPMTDPVSTNHYYNYMNGLWRDGTPLTVGGSGYNPSNTDPSKITKYAFNGEPNDPKGWSMASAKLPFGDRRCLYNNGPFLLKSGSVQELSFAISWVAYQKGGANVNLAAIRQASLKAREKFERCFGLRGPDAPQMQTIEQDKSLILNWGNSNPSSNNLLQGYGNEIPLAFELGAKDTFYKFEGYKIYQLADENIDIIKDKNDLNKARLIAQFDVNNGVKEIYNWNAVSDPLNPILPIFNPILRASGSDSGIKNSLEVKTDAFASSPNNQLVNGKKYHFVVIAYAHNNYKSFDKKTGLGQQNPYIESTQLIKNISGTPKPLVSTENILQNADKQSISVYPNPFFKTQYDKVYLNSIPQNAEISIFSVSGQLIFQQKNKSIEGIVELNLKNHLPQMPSGMYFISIKNGDKQSVVKWLMIE